MQPRPHQKYHNPRIRCTKNLYKVLGRTIWRNSGAKKIESDYLFLDMCKQCGVKVIILSLLSGDRSFLTGYK